jgi:hypothetical protein
MAVTSRQRLDEGAGAGQRNVPAPPLLAVEGDEDDRSRGRRLRGQHARQFDEDPDATPVVVGAGRAGRRVVVSGQDEERRAGSGAPSDDVDSGEAPALELGEMDVGEPRGAELRLDVLRGAA